MARIAVEKNISYDELKKLYYVNMDYGKDDGGKRIKKTKTYSKKSEAKAALKEFEANKTKGTLVIPKETTLKEWLEYWMNNVVIPNREQSTVYYYKNIIDNHIVPALGDIPIQQLKPKQIQQYYTMLINEKKLSSNTARKHHDLLNTALKLAVKQDILLQNPIDKVEPPKLIRKEVECYNSDEFEKFCDLVKDNRLEIVAKLAGYLGLRREEICGLKWENVNMENRLIHICEVRTQAGSKIIEKKTKTESSNRVLYIPDELLTTLQQEKEKQDVNKKYFGEEYIKTGYVFAHDNGEPYRPNYISELFTKFVTDNHLSKLVLHGLRHTFASIANSANVTAFDIGKAMGHSTTATTTKVYMHMFDKSNEDTMKRVADKINEEKLKNH